MDMITGIFDNPSAKVLAILGMLSAVSMLLRAFGNADNAIIKTVSKIVDFFSANVKHE